MYQVELEQFNGPLDLLLKLIQDKELDISQISLAKIADQYLGYIDAHEGEIDPEGLADFLWIGSRLIYLKSRLLVPKIEEEVEEDEGDLAKQLKIYQEFLEANKKIIEIIKKEKFIYSQGKQEIVPGFYPPENLKLSDLQSAFERVIKDITPMNKLPEQKIRRVVSLKQRIHEIRNFIFTKAKKIGFSSLLRDKECSKEKIVTFLAVLELSKQNSVELHQESLFSEIKITKV